MSRTRHITLPGGFTAAGVACGIKESGKEDLAIFCADTDAATAIVTTRNQVVGAPVLWCRKILPRGYGKVRALVVNAGNSNVCTGPGGLKDAETMARLTADRLATQTDRVLVASTGVIGHRLPMANVRKGIAAAADVLGRRGDGAALRAIMTTDSREKSAVVQLRLGGRQVTVAGIAKGSGMIAPSMATMIAVVTTDAPIAPRLLHKAVKQAVGASFNAITVDSDTSTSDTLVVMASGAAGGKPIRPASRELAKFSAALGEVCGELARAIVDDGEGATKVVQIAVDHARNARDAEIAAKAVANSPLVKCALHGCDPNWGRIVAALGKSAARIEPDKLRVRIGSTTVFARGRGSRFDAAKLSKYMAGRFIEIRCDLGLAQGAYTALTCDLSREYIAINADYHT